MCILCGCATCSGEAALDSATDQFNLSSVETNNNGRANYKWGNDVRGQESDEVTWSLNLAGLSIVAGSNISEFTTAVFDAFETWSQIVLKALFGNEA